MTYQKITIPLDHGNRNMKTAEEVFTSGLVESDLKPVLGEYLQYNGKYYSLTGERIPYMRDKTLDDRFFILTLFGIGKELEKRLDAAHITCNKNTVPNDPRSPFVTSGVRLGTPAVTTRGLKEDDMDMIAECIALVLQSEDNIEKVKGMVAELTAKYPLDM